MTYSADNENRPPVREPDVLSAAIDVLRDRLPETWSLSADFAPSRDRQVDALLTLRAPDGTEVRLVVEAKRLLNTRDVPYALEQLDQVAAGFDDGGAVRVLVARYLAPSTRERIVAAGAGYIDATGNLLVASERPALFVRDRGADKDPWRGPGRPRGSLKGPAAARVVRALVDFTPPFGVPDLTKKSGSSTGVAYRVVEFLEEQGLLEREPRGPITSVRWRDLLERWSRDYGFAQSNTVETFLEPRGLGALFDRLAKAPDFEYVVTGSVAAERFAPYAPARLATLYVRNLDEAASVLGLRPTSVGANVALAVGDYDVVFERAKLLGGLRVAAPSQVVVDLMTGPGRNPSEAEALLDWMEADERLWRI
jgi:hypothetical protein